MLDEQKEILNEEMKERLEHRGVLQDIQWLIDTKAGKNFVKYLFKNFEVGELPPVGINGDLLMDRLGFLRAGNSIFKIIAEANSEAAGQILGQIEKEKYAEMEYAFIKQNR